MPDGVPDSINLFIFDELQAKIQAAANGKHDIQYEDLNHAGVTTSDGYATDYANSNSLSS